MEQYFNVSFNQSPKIADLAQLLKLSPVQTQRVIRKNYGTNFSEKITQRRMELARSLLLKNQLSVAEIALATGYNTEGNFFSTFKRYYGTTPKQYQKLYLQKAGDL